MVFNSPTFLFLFIPFTLLFYLLLNKKFRNLFLLLASLIFYAFAGLQYVPIILLSIAMNYFFGIAIERASKRGSSRAVLSVSLIVNLLVLLDSKKITIFFIKLCGIHLDKVNSAVGVSFFTFGALAYVIDIYRQKNKAQRNPIDFGLFMALFPKLTAGPIVRYYDLEQYLDSRSVTLNDFAYGVKRFIIGLGKKVLLADTLARTVDQVMGMPREQLTTELAWLGIISYTLQVYLDFSGYSDMAIGLGRMFGFHFLENFNYPYISRSITEFWRRWHISLSSWFKDYLYIPLGGNRRSPGRTYLNLIVVFLLCGLWHGRAWNFVIWGGFHGLFLILERWRLGNLLKKTPAFFQHAYAVLIITLSWVFFSIESMPKAVNFIRALFGSATGSRIANNIAMYLNAELGLVLTLAVLSSTPILQKGRQFAEMISKGGNRAFEKALLHLLPFSEAAALSLVLLLSVISLASSTYNPFIYFRF